MPRKCNKQKWIFWLEKEKFDGNHYDDVNEPLPGIIFGDINEDTQFQITQNPYYGGEVDSGSMQLKIINNPYYNGEKWKIYSYHKLS